MAATLGLPKHVSNFLRHMEIHKECLKWNITETSHKITLTLTWNFRKPNKGKDSLWDRLQRTLKMSRSVDDENVPSHASAFVVSPEREQRPPLQRNLTWTGPFHNRQLTWSRSQSTGSTLSPPNRAPLRRQQNLQHAPLCRSVSISPSRFTWPGESLSVDIPPRHTPSPVTSHSGRGALTRSHSATSPTSQNRIKLAYRTEQDVTHSLEDLLEKETKKNQQQYNSIKHNWNRQVSQDWPHITCRRGAEGSHNQSFNSDITTATESEISLEVNQTVQKCIKSCDNILYRHSTVIT